MYKKYIFGKIKTNDGYMTHHFTKINDEIYEFSKGTLKNLVDWYDIYDVESEDETIYKLIYET